LKAIMDKPEGHSHSDVYRSVKNRILAGEFGAGEKLKPDEVRDRYGISASAMREVFIRLAAERIVTAEEQRGFRIPEASEKRLTELMNVRILLECEGARLSMKYGDVEWEARMSAAHHKLAHIEKKMKDSRMIEPFVSIWTRIDWEFHDTLMSACGSDILRETHRSIYDQFRQQVVAELDSFGFRDCTIPEHFDILTAAVNRDAEACCHAIDRHLQTYRDDMRSEKRSA